MLEIHHSGREPSQCRPGFEPCCSHVDFSGCSSHQCLQIGALVFPPGNSRVDPKAVSSNRCSGVSPLGIPGWIPKQCLQIGALVFSRGNSRVEPTPVSSNHALVFPRGLFCLLVAYRPSNMRVYLRDGSAQTVLRPATLR